MENSKPRLSRALRAACLSRHKLDLRSSAKPLKAFGNLIGHDYVEIRNVADVRKVRNADLRMIDGQNHAMSFCDDRSLELRFRQVRDGNPRLRKDRLRR